MNKAPPPLQAGQDGQVCKLRAASGSSVAIFNALFALASANLPDNQLCSGGLLIMRASFLRARLCCLVIDMIYPRRLRRGNAASLVFPSSGRIFRLLFEVIFSSCLEPPLFVFFVKELFLVACCYTEMQEQ